MTVSGDLVTVLFMSLVPFHISALLPRTTVFIPSAIDIVLLDLGHSTTSLAFTITGTRKPSISSRQTSSFFDSPRAPVFSTVQYSLLFHTTFRKVLRQYPSLGDRQRMIQSALLALAYHESYHDMLHYFVWIYVVHRHSSHRVFYQ